ncbi:hypothetical protein UlMin_016470 [Ulmus minor]
MIIKSAALVLFYFLWSLPIATFSQSSNVSESNIHCLKSIKDSIDPYHYLSWNFSQNTSGFICLFTGVECWNPDENEVLSIQLSHMELKGNFPQGIEYCTNIGRLDLSNNELTGTIPSDIGMLMPSLTSLRLSFNKFSGEIPKSLAKIPHLNVLELDNNQLTGHLPEELGLLLDLTTFSVADNLLSGPIPEFRLASFPQESYENNPQLCGRPLHSCNKHTSKLNYPFKIGFTIAYLLSTIVVFIFSSSSYLPWPKQVWKTTKNEAYQLNDWPTSKPIIQIPGFERLVNKISFTELRRATKNFSEDNVIGVGKTGTVYKATLPNASLLAVKRLHDSQEDQGQLVSELLTLARLKHDNLIPLLGFCLQNSERLLVYKYMSNGNLRDWLNTVQGGAKILEWPLRVKIAIGIARGLAWIHHECDFKVVHRNISSTCILLDQYFEPRISNFHKAIMSNHGGAMFAYLNENDSGFLMNSEMWETGFVKEDVYNFGVVLVDLITGKESNSIVSSSSSSLHTTLVEWINDDVTNHVIDKSLISQGFDGEILQVLRIASECVQPVPCQRPTMLQVYNSIRNLGDRYNISFDSGSASGGEIVEIQ